MDYKIQEKQFSITRGCASGSFVIRSNRNILIEINFDFLYEKYINNLPQLLKIFNYNNISIKCNGKKYEKSKNEYDIFTSKDIKKILKNKFNDEEINVIQNVINDFYKRLELVKRIGL